MAKSEPRREETLEGRLLLAAADWLTLLLLSAGAIFPCLSAYGISAPHGFDSGAVLAFCVFGSLAAAALFSWRRWAWTLLAVLTAEWLILWRMWHLVTEDWSFDRSPGLLDLIDKYPGSLFLLYALAILALGWIVVRARVWWLAAALATLPLLPAIQSGTLPAWGWMLAGFAGWGSMLLTALFSRRDADSLARARFVSLGGMAALLLALVICLPIEGYTRPQWATNARTSLIRSVTRQLDRFFDLEAMEGGLLADLGLDLSIPGEGTGNGPGQWTGSGGLESEDGGWAGLREDLLSAGPLRYTRRQIMTVRTDQPDSAGRIYLRGVSFDSYTGTSWEQSRELADFAEAERFPALTAPETAEYTMRIRNTAFSGVWYYPYRFTGGGTMDGSGRIVGMSGTTENDLLLSNWEEYSVTYCPGGPADGFIPLIGNTAREEEAYRFAIANINILSDPGIIMDSELGSAVHIFSTDHLMQPYLSVPQELLGILAPLAVDIQRIPVTVDPNLPEQFREAVAAAARTAGYLASIADYDPDTPAMDPDGDFMTHFLEEGRGFCVHFATAGTLLLRMQGVPARYVSGYVADLDGRGRGTVMDSDAHAWVEIYLDGYGWYPVEMTPGYAGGISGVELAGGAEAADPADETPEDLPETPEEDEPEDETPDDSDPDAELPEDDELPDEEETGWKIPSEVWAVLFVLAALWAVLCAAYLAAVLIRRRAREDKDTNRSVLNAYGRYRRLRRWGCGEDGELDRLANKAKFSQHTLSEEERESAWKCLNEDLKQSRIGQPGRRRWMLDLLSPLF